jgi:DNA-binding transcriptional regulator YdaS (Cro superfamily)
MSKESIKQAAAILGGQTGLARALNVSSGMVHQWVHGLRPLAAEHCPIIERATAGQVRCEDLRPDVDWAVLRCSCGEKEAA